MRLHSCHIARSTWTNCTSPEAGSRVRSSTPPELQIHHHCHTRPLLWRHRCTQRQHNNTVATLCRAVHRGAAALSRMGETPSVRNVTRSILILGTISVHLCAMRAVGPCRSCRMASGQRGVHQRGCQLSSLRITARRPRWANTFSQPGSNTGTDHSTHCTMTHTPRHGSLSGQPKDAYSRGSSRKIKQQRESH